MERRLAAVLMADVVGYSRLIEADEAGTLAILKERRTSILDPTVRAHGGRIVKVMGDGVLVEFASAVNAVAGAVDLLRKMMAANADLPDARRIVLRIGINLGDVIGEGGDIYGEGVNIAARLESLAEPGGICISSKVHEEVRGKLSATFEDMGEQTVKNVARPVRAYRWRAEGARDGAPQLDPALALPDKPSIAVLPFQNMSGDAEQDYFADGMVEEIITALSRIRWLFVIARNSTFAYKGQAVDVKRIGRELGVRYVLEGSVRRSAGKLRIAGQLIDASSGAHLWADRFDGTLEDIFDLQDQLTANVVGAIAPKLEQAEIERVKRKPTESLDAYDCFLRGLAGLHQWSRDGNEEALSHFYRAIELDPNFAAAHGLAARAYVQRNSGGWVRDRGQEIVEATRLARRAVELGQDDALALCTAGFALADICGEADDGDAFIDRAIALNPNLAWGWVFSGWVKASIGEPDIALERLARAIRLSPNDPQAFSAQAAMAFAHFVAGRYGEALSCAEAAARNRPSYLLATVTAAACAALAGRTTEAQKAVARLRLIDPDFRISKVHALQYMRPEDLARWADGLRRAGVPE
jgi:TolB-like protein/class 3 adenylate cyclase/Tfp pilus assembly protein PilF